MKILLFTPILCFLTNISWFGEIDFIEVRIQTGLTIYGTTSVTLIKEGLVCRTTKIVNGKVTEYVDFYKMKKLDIPKVLEVQKYILENQIFEVTNLYVPETYVYSGGTTIISFYAYATRQCNSFEYIYCDSQIDTLIKLINELIPKNKKEFTIAPKC
jgi:hypothetical protein